MIEADHNYLARLIGVHQTSGKRIFAPLQGRCASDDAPYSGASIARGLHDDSRVVLFSNEQCKSGGGIRADHNYTGRLVGKHQTSGKRIFAVACRTCTDPCGTVPLNVSMENPDCPFFDGLEFNIAQAGVGSHGGCLYEATLNYPELFGPFHSWGCTCGFLFGGGITLFFVCYRFRYEFVAGTGHRAELQWIVSPCPGGGVADNCGGLTSTIYWPGPTADDFDSSNLDWSNPLLLTSTATFHADHCCGTTPLGGIDNHLTVTVTKPT